MSVIATDFVTKLSGGASNAVGNASLGGVQSSSAAPTTTDNLFGPVSAADATAGKVYYRCVYLLNNNGTTAMTNALAYFSAVPVTSGDTVAMGLGSSGINGTEQTVANETTAPTGVTFTTPTNAATGIALGSIPAGQHVAIWIRRTIAAGAGNSPSDGFTMSYQAETT